MAVALGVASRSIGLGEEFAAKLADAVLLEGSDSSDSTAYGLLDLYTS